MIRIHDRFIIENCIALRDYEGRVTNYSFELIGKVAELSGRPINASAWFNYFSFDVMGDFAFGKSFDMLKSGKTHFAIEWLESSMLLLGACSPLAWAIPVGAITPILGSTFRKFIAWCSEQAEIRRKTKTQVPDIASWLLKAAEDESDTEATKWLHGDSRLIIVAGSDTVAIVLTHIFYYLAKNSIHLTKLRQELDPLMSSDRPFNVRDVQDAKHMNGIINEVLRLHPPVPSGTGRTIPPQGVTVDGVFIPGGTNVMIPFFTIGRLAEECFVRGHDFIPERWYSQPELIKERSAFTPFSLGPYACIGQKLAQMELKTVVPLLISKFDVRLAPREDGTALLENSKDAFTLRMGELKVIFEERKHP
ncbi:hypothetical protein ACLMJK_001875 [Lecanora helva]